MSYTQTAIANLAMGHLGDREITDINDNLDDDAVELKSKYSHARNLIYEMHDWIWARDSAQLQRKTTTPASRYDYAYALPANYRRLSNISRYEDMRQQLDEFQIVNREIQTDEEYVFMDFVSSKWDEPFWPAYFANCVGLQLAILTCNRITNHKANKAELQKALKNMAMPDARTIDSQQQPARKRYIRSEWAQHRFAGRRVPNLRRNA